MNNYWNIAIRDWMADRGLGLEEPFVIGGYESYGRYHIRWGGGVLTLIREKGSLHCYMDMYGLLTGLVEMREPE